MRTYITMFLALFMTTSVAYGQVAKIGKRGETVPVLYVHTIHSTEGETELGFVMRVGVWMRNFTTTGGYEACGNIARTDKGLAVRIYTSNSHIACLTDLAPVAGFTDTGKSIHSHPVVEQMVINEVDRAFMQGQSNSFRPIPQKARFRPDPRTFSNIDYEGGPGYLITDGKVLFQEGRGTSVQVAVLPPRDTSFDQVATE